MWKPCAASALKEPEEKRTQTKAHLATLILVAVSYQNYEKQGRLIQMAESKPIVVASVRTCMNNAHT